MLLSHQYQGLFFGFQVFLVAEAFVVLKCFWWLMPFGYETIGDRPSYLPEGTRPWGKVKTR